MVCSCVIVSLFVVVGEICVGFVYGCVMLNVSMSLVPHCGHVYVCGLLVVCPQLRQFAYVTVVLVSGSLFLIRFLARDKGFILFLSWLFAS